MSAGLGIVGQFSSTSNSATIPALATDFTFTADVTVGRAYVLGFSSQYISPNYTYTVAVTDGTDTWSFAYMRVTASAIWIGTRFTAGIGSAAPEQLYIPTTSGTKTFSVVLLNKAGSSTANSQFTAAPTAPRRFWLRDLGQYPVSGAELGLVSYAQAITNVGLNPNNSDTLTTTATLQAAARYRLIYRGQFSIQSGSSLNLGINYGSGGIPAVISWGNYGPPYTNVFALGDIVVPAGFSGSKTFTPRNLDTGATMTAIGSPSIPRQLWLERIV